ncbi:SOS response-associated peptidase family protein [Paenibacillus sonchi]|uniref:SOS response-associated peptidase family protein n=1 Tax=Paenibacillus sonchi TaxID=373687 RepID=UPI0022B92628|nr:SOS response-associated peptidase family protein [Paenibacillus sonchi]
MANHGNRLEELHCGLVPFWAKNKKIGNKMINARAETVAEKSAFIWLLKPRSCITRQTGSSMNERMAQASNPCALS